jgi:cyd operon protein YbgT
MWYFAWILGIGFAVLLAILNAMWGENEAARLDAGRPSDNAPADGND